MVLGAEQLPVSEDFDDISVGYMYDTMSSVRQSCFFSTPGQPFAPLIRRKALQQPVDVSSVRPILFPHVWDY